jgi:type IV pilus assembly protein PilQ
MDLQDASLKDVLKIFSIQSGLNFISSESVQDRRITLYLDKVPIKEAMEKLFKANNLSYDYDAASNIFIVQYWGDLEIATITKVFKLKYRSVPSSTIAREKNSLFATSGITGALSSTTSSAGASGEDADIVKAVKQVLSKNGKISEDGRTNSIVVTDIPSRFPVIEEVIASLDLPQPQVMLEVEMIDVNKSIVDKLGFNVGTMTAPNPLTLIFPHVGLGHSKSFIGNLANRKATLETAGIAGSVVLGSNYAALLDFLSQQSDTKYLARPRILTLNNETAEIGVTKDEVVTKKKVWVSNSVEAGGGHWEDTYERATSLSLTSEGIGIFLRVTPLINEETNEITMVINPKTSSASQSESIDIATTVARDPEVRSTKSIVKVKDGETIVLGGLIHKEKKEILKKVPIFGDIPIVGALFRHKDVDKNYERELLVFITPHIVREQSTKLAQGSKATLPYSEPYPSSKSERRETIDNFLNIFEGKKER